uniref:Signal recognition particle receptor subunit alpha n=1 Tax=Candidatus Phytoplasma australasiaticum subsp. australasiaticum TaxID=2832407 RepID=A0A7S7JLW6_9MOLU|nr:signal recognition particle receptor subunit alpha ['Parthenium hysterophorus' phyllody phytoplasma]
MKKIFCKFKNLSEEQIPEWVQRIKSQNKLTDNLLDELKILLLKSDLGLESTQNLMNQIRKNISSDILAQPKYFLNFLKEQILLFYQQNNKSNNNDNISKQKPQIYLLWELMVLAKLPLLEN